jgi:hypothetical protein
MIASKNRLSQEVKNGVLYLNIGLVLIMIMTAIVYLVSIGDSAQMGYSFTVKEIEHTQLKNENENLKHQILRVSSLDNLKSQNNQLNLMQTAEVEFFETRLDRLSKR